METLKWLDYGQHPVDWNGPIHRNFTEIRDEDLERPILAHLERAARQYSNRLAVTDSNTSLSFKELWEGLSGLAETIETATNPGELIGIVLPPCSMFPVAILACLAAGRPFVAIDPHYPGDWLRQVLEDARPALIITGENVLKGIETGAPTPRVLQLDGLPQPARESWQPAELGVDEPACVLFTSGSTGRPKGIVNSQRNLLQRVAQSINAAHINAEDRLLTLASPCTVVGVRDMITALVAGASLHVLDAQRLGAREILNVIHQEAITILFAFPALLRSVLAYSVERATDVLRLVRVGGDTTLWSDIDLLRGWLAPESAIQLIFAATEAPMMQWFVDDSFRSDDPRVPVGYPLPGNRLALVDEHGSTTPSGEIGELVVESPYVALGLWVDGHCDDAMFESHGGSSRLFRTRDLVRQRPDGLLDRIGRKDRQVKIRGARVDLDGVEAALRRHPFVADAAALARTTADGVVTLVAYVSTRESAPPGLLDDLKQRMRSTPPPMRPARLYLTESIPRLPSSKPDSRALMALDDVNIQRECAFAAASVEVDPAADRVAQTVTRVWQEVLRRPVRGPVDDFFEAGGDSLQAITFVMELERALDLPLSLTLVSETPTFARLCEALRDHHAMRYVPLVSLKSGGHLPPVFFIHGVGGTVAGLFPTARRMTYPGPVIGIQARGLTGSQPPHESVEAMADEYLKEIKALQPNGPYYLCGYSFGGLVAFEIARRLRQSGDEVGMVGLFDTMMSPLRWPLHSWFSLLRRAGIQFAAAIGTTPVHTWPATIRKIADRICDGLRGHGFSNVVKVAVNALRASARYQPGFYPGELTLFTPAARKPGMPSIQAIWSKHARALSIVETAGTHSTMLSAPHAESAASSLTRCLPSLTLQFGTPYHNIHTP